jgi:hypothetical protein
MDDGGSDDELDDTPDDEDDEDDIESLEEKFRQLEEEVATLVADVHDLALYTKLNLTGFMKIVKKHDVSVLSIYASHSVKAVDAPRRNKPSSRSRVRLFKTTWISVLFINTTGTQSSCVYAFFIDPRCSIISLALIQVKLSKLYDLVRTRGHPIQGDSSAGGTQNAFVRQTTKYWVCRFDSTGRTNTDNQTGASRQHGASQACDSTSFACPWQVSYLLSRSMND